MKSFWTVLILDRWNLVVLETNSNLNEWSLASNRSTGRMTMECAGSEIAAKNQAKNLSFFSNLHHCYLKKKGGDLIWIVMIHVARIQQPMGSIRPYSILSLALEKKKTKAWGLILAMNRFRMVGGTRDLCQPEIVKSWFIPNFPTHSLIVKVSDGALFL